MKHIVLCADDYGQNLAISQGIINLLQKQRLSAVSCLTTSANWLQPFVNHIDVGLHFNLTEGKPLGAMSQFAPHEKFPHLAKVLLQSHLRQIKQNEIITELQRQLDQFTNKLGKEPDFIDGHQHIHHLPIVRDALLTVYQQRWPTPRPYIRIAHQQMRIPHLSIKSLIILLTGALSLQRKLHKMNIPFNSSFAGIYDFKKAETYAQQFPKFLTAVQEHGLIMCHPGLTSDDPLDAIANSRAHEYRYFMSDLFMTHCNKNNVVIGRLT